MRPCQTSSSTRKIWHTENHYIYNTGRNMSKIGLTIGHLRYICIILKAQMDSNTVDMSWHTFTKWEKCMKCKKSVCLKKLHFSWKHAIKWKHTNSYFMTETKGKQKNQFGDMIGSNCTIGCLSLGKIFGLLGSRDREKWAFKPFHIPFYYLFTTRGGLLSSCVSVDLRAWNARRKTTVTQNQCSHLAILTPVKKLLPSPSPAKIQKIIRFSPALMQYSC